VSTRFTVTRRFSRGFIRRVIFIENRIGYVCRRAVARNFLSARTAKVAPHIEIRPAFPIGKKFRARAGNNSFWIAVRPRHVLSTAVARPDEFPIVNMGPTQQSSRHKKECSASVCFSRGDPTLRKALATYLGGGRLQRCRCHPDRSSLPLVARKEKGDDDSSMALVHRGEVRVIEERANFIRLADLWFAGHRRS